MPYAHRPAAPLRGTLLCFVALCAAPAFGQSEQELAQAMAQAQMGSATALPDVVALTDGDVTRFIRLVEELDELGVELDARALGENPGVLGSLAARDKALGAINRAGFSPEQLPPIGYSIALAFAAVTQDMDELDRGLAEMEAMKSTMSPEQWAMMSAAMGTAYQMMQQLKSQPPGNIALAQKHRSELERVFDR